MSSIYDDLDAIPMGNSLQKERVSHPKQGYPDGLTEMNTHRPRNIKSLGNPASFAYPDEKGGPKSVVTPGELGASEGGDVLYSFGKENNYYDMSNPKVREFVYKPSGYEDGYVVDGLPYVYVGGDMSLSSVDISRMQNWLKGYLIKNQKIRDSIHWKASTRGFTNSWDFKSQDSFLSSTSNQLYRYMAIIEKIYLYEGIIQPQPGLYKPHIRPRLNLPKSLNVKNSDQKMLTKQQENLALTVYLAYIANSLVLELHSILDWRLDDYNHNSLSVLLGSESFYTYDGGLVALHTKLSPSDPTELFIWMYRQKTVNSGKWIENTDRVARPSRNDDKKRFELRGKARDAILRYWGSIATHPLGFSSNGSWFRTDGKLIKGYNSYNYYAEALWGTPGLPSTKDLIKGHLVNVDLYKNTNSFYSPLAEVPHPLKNKWLQFNLPKSSFVMHTPPIGCWGTCSLLSYLFRIINIPAFPVSDLFISIKLDKNNKARVESSHCSLVMPAETNPKSPQTYILLHGDRLYNADVRFPNPYYPPPFTKLFKTWPELEAHLTQRFAHYTSSPMPASLLREPKYSFTSYSAGEKRKLIEYINKNTYGDRYGEVSKYFSEKLCEEYPPLAVIIDAMMGYQTTSPFQSNLISSILYKQNQSYYKGFGDWLYRRKELPVTNFGKKISRAIFDGRLSPSPPSRYELLNKVSKDRILSALVYWHTFDELYHAKHRLNQV